MDIKAGEVNRVFGRMDNFKKYGFCGEKGK
jgi:hypothetical protein